jgi:DNA polymerase
MPDILSLDFETFSLCDLKASGSYVYSRHPSTGVSCMAWAFNSEPVQMWTPGQPFPQRIIQHVLAGGQVHGWNVTFEFYIWNHVLFGKVHNLPQLLLSQVHDTMARGAYWGLPMSLDAAGAAIGAAFQKDKIGHALMLRMSKPRRFDAYNDPVWWHNEDPGKYAALQAYCMRDVETERDIASRLPLLPDDERAIWLMDARMNLRGFMLDTKVVTLFTKIIEDELKRLSKRMSAVTGGAVPSVTNVAKLTHWLRLNGVVVESLAKGDMADMLIDPEITGAPREALLIRKEAAKTSTAKLNAMVKCAGPDDRVRGLVMHYGATRTGRWAGRLVQVQNLPRPLKGIDTDMVIRDVLNGADAETVQFVHGPVLDAVSSSLRACFVAKPGHTFAVCDYSAIEARVIAWLAGQNDILKVFASGEDVYVYTADKIGSTDRQLGKVSVLGLGFGMGSNKFVESAATYKITLSPERAQEVVTAWRKANSKIVSFWYDLDRAARDAIENNASTQVGRVIVRMGRGPMTGSMLIVLPSGRKLAYRNARLEYDGEGKQSITYDGTDQKTRKWETLRTYGGKLAENITQAVARCLLADAMLRMERNHLPIVASIHDEVVCEVPEAMATASFNQMKTIMSDGPAWADGLPLGGAGYVGKRYAKG